jgi:hypothetical protein
MSQLTIYLDPETQRKIEEAARREAVSLSRWAREHLARAADASSTSAWDHLASFSGIAEDFEAPERTGLPREAPSLDA